MKIILSKLLALTGLLFIAAGGFAQGKLTIDNIRSVQLKNSGTIVEGNEIKGYYFLYESDKIDKNTNEYTLELLDNNLNKIKDVKFEDDKEINLVESSYNGNSILFLFYNSKESLLEYRVYGFDGKQKMDYEVEVTKKTKRMMADIYSPKSEKGQNVRLFDIENKGYVTVDRVKESKYYSFTIDYFSTINKKHWTYEEAEEQEDKFATSVYLGYNDTYVFFEITKQKHLLSNEAHAWLLAINIANGRKAFEVSMEKEGDYKFYPMNIAPVVNSDNVMLLGTYYDKGDRILKDKSLGLASWIIDPKGNVTSKKYNSWTEDIGKYLKTDSKGRVDDIGYIYFHKIFQTSDGKFFAIGEGYKKVVTAGSVALKAISMIGGGNANATRVRVTDMVVMEFNDKFEITKASIFDKFSNTIDLMAGTDFLSPHTMALLVKMMGGFDYDYTQLSSDKKTFAVGFHDYEKTSDFKGLTFNSITNTNEELSRDKINLKSKASELKVFPAKTGSVMIMEYFKKEKRLEMRLEKLN